MNGVIINYCSCYLLVTCRSSFLFFIRFSVNILQSVRLYECDLFRAPCEIEKNPTSFAIKITFRGSNNTKSAGQKTNDLSSTLNTKSSNEFFVSS